MSDILDTQVLHRIQKIMIADANSLASIAEDFDIDPVRLHALFIALHKECYDSIINDN